MTDLENIDSKDCRLYVCSNSFNSITKTWSNFLEYASTKKLPHETCGLIGADYILRCLKDDFQATYVFDRANMVRRYVQFPNKETMTVFLLRFKS